MIIYERYHLYVYRNFYVISTKKKTFTHVKTRKILPNICFSLPRKCKEKIDFYFIISFSHFYFYYCFCWYFFMVHWTFDMKKSKSQINLNVGVCQYFCSSKKIEYKVKYFWKPLKGLFKISKNRKIKINYHSYRTNFHVRAQNTFL